MARKELCVLRSDVLPEFSSWRFRIEAKGDSDVSRAIDEMSTCERYQRAAQLVASRAIYDRIAECRKALRNAGRA